MGMTTPLRHAAAVLVSATLVLAACGDDDGDVTAGGPGGADEPVSTTVDPADPTGPTDPEPEVVEPTGNANDVHRIDWQELRDVDDGDDRTHLVTFWGGVAPCFVVDHVDVEEAPEQVTITVFAGSAPEAEGQACIELAKHMAVEVTLDEPLGDREVVDGGERPEGQQ